MIRKKKDVMGKQFYRGNKTEFALAEEIRTIDMVRAGLHVLRRKEIISQDVFESWIKSDKAKINAHIGKYLGHHFIEINDEITRVVDKFILDNRIDINNIVSRDRDAITVRGESPKIMEIDGYKFAEKEKYTSFVKNEGYILFYDFETDGLYLKGLNRSLFVNNPIYPVIKELFKTCELFKRGLDEYKTVFAKIKEVKEKYVEGGLPIEAYRELNMNNKFRYVRLRKDGTVISSIMSECELDKEDYNIDASYNYSAFIKPFTAILSTFSPENYGV